ncbi:HERV-H LTR-associating protein 2 [Ctenodactylus gundi]
MKEKLVIGRCDEDVILPCSFENGPEVVIHWKNQDNSNIHSYYKGSDHLEKQDPRFVNRTFLFHSKIQSGNASLLFRRLSLLDEGIYVCYVGTAMKQITNKVVLKVGAFPTPVMMYEKRNSSRFLVCSVRSVFPRPHITWKTDTVSVSESKREESGYLGPFYINSTLNITGSNSSYKCTIENPLLKQTWTGQWTLRGALSKMRNEDLSLSCQVDRNLTLLNQDYTVTWSRMEGRTSTVLACYLSSSQIITIKEPRFSWNKELLNQSDFPMTLRDLSFSDSGEYLCNISSKEYTLLTIQPLHIEPSPRRVLWRIVVVVLPICMVFLILIVSYCQRKKRRQHRTSSAIIKMAKNANKQNAKTTHSKYGVRLQGRNYPCSNPFQRLTSLE